MTDTPKRLSTPAIGQRVAHRDEWIGSGTVVAVERPPRGLNRYAVQWDAEPSRAASFHFAEELRWLRAAGVES